MIKFELFRNDISIEIYSRSNNLTQLELLKEASKTIQREVIKLEQNPSAFIIRQPSNDQLP